MAFVLEQEDQNKQPAAGSTPSNTSTIPTTGGGAGSSGSPTTPNTAPANPGFANLNQYLQANQGQAPQVASNIASNLGTQYNQLSNDINSAAQGASQAVQAGTVPLNQSVINQAVQNPAQFVSDPNNLAAWNAQKNAAYTGPTSFETAPQYAQANAAATKGATTAALGQSSGGYGQLLNQLEKNPTAGKSALDLGLIQSDPNASGQIQGALKPFSGLQDLLKSSSQNIGQAAQQAQNTTAATAAATKAATDQPIQNLQNDITAQVNQALNERNNYNTNFQKFSDTLQPYQNLAQRFIDVSGSGTNPYTTSLKLMTNAPTAEQVATPQEFANQAALAQLSGQNINTLNPALANQADSFRVPGVAPDLNSLMADRDAQIKIFGKADPGTEQQIAQLQANPNLYANISKLPANDLASQYLSGNQSVINSNALNPLVAAAMYKQLQPVLSNPNVSQQDKDAIEAGKNNPEVLNNYLKTNPSSELQSLLGLYNNLPGSSERFLPNGSTQFV